jgi:hypothetical protein
MTVRGTRADIGTSYRNIDGLRQPGAGAWQPPAALIPVILVRPEPIWQLY